MDKTPISTGNFDDRKTTSSQRDAAVAPSAATNSPAATFDPFACDAYLFDIDGTLLNMRDTLHYEASLHALASVCGHPVSLSDLPIHGSTESAIFVAALERAGFAASAARALLPHIYPLIADEIDAHLDEFHATICPGVVRLLDELGARGKLLAITTGNIERVAWSKLRRAGLDRYFAFGAFSDRLETRTAIFQAGAAQARQRLANPAARLCFLGDTPADVRAAHECATPVIATATGVFSVDQLAAGAPTLAIPNFHSLFSASH